MILRFTKTIHSEYRTIFTHSGVMLVMIFAPLIYAVLYSSAYAKQVATEVPIAVIDHSNTHSSRALASTLNASPYIDITHKATDMPAAQRLLFDENIYGVIYIPQDYEDCDLQGHQRTISLYLDASYFLMYRQVLEGVAGAISSIKEAQPKISLRSHTLYNPALGYGTFIMPAVLLVILQQTALMGIGIVGALRRKRVASSLLSRIFVYVTIYAPLCAYIFAIHYRVFGYPENGGLIGIIAVIASYMIAVISLALALSTLFRRVETPLILIIWTSIPVLLISGASLPVESFPHWMHTLGLLLPSSSAVPAFIRVQSMGATVGEVMPEIVRLWVLIILYCVIYKQSIRAKLLGYPMPQRDIHTLL